MTDPESSPNKLVSNKLVSYDPLERGQAVAKSLADAARRARFSARARGAFQEANPHAQRAARAMRNIRIALFLILVVATNLISIVYFGFIASYQYVSEAKFTVSSGAIPKMDGLGAVTGVPPAMIFQDTQIIVSYIESRDLVEALEKDIKLRDIYGSDAIDFWSRFKKTKPIEKFTDYWDKMTKAAITFPAGIVTLSVRAFSPEDAKKVADAIIAHCETLVNSLNERMLQETIAAAEQNLDLAAEHLKVTRLAYEKARNTAGIIDVTQMSGILSTVYTNVNAQLLKAQSDYQLARNYQSENFSQVRYLKSKIAALELQLASLKEKMTTQSQDPGSKSLSGQFTQFSELDLEQKLAESRYAIASSSLDGARMLRDTKMIYLHRIISPALPEEAKYPRRFLTIMLTFFGSLILWALTTAFTGFIRNHMAR